MDHARAECNALREDLGNILTVASTHAMGEEPSSILRICDAISGDDDTQFQSTVGAVVRAMGPADEALAVILITCIELHVHSRPIVLI